MLGSRKNRLKATPRRRTVSIESLETRQLLSAVANEVVQSDAVFLHPSASTSTTIQGYSPAQVSKAYGFDTTTFNNGATAANGSGQTIAIVDAFNDPNVAADLSVFDSQFGLSAPPSLRVVNQSGGTTLPTTDAGWAGEIALDVEWAHAMAPGANILLVEANSDTLSSLMTAVDYARKVPGVSAVSMSWGGSEFFSFNGSEFTGQTQYDSIFTTPAGHQGVTFLAAAGDSGVYGGVQWPASSPNVVAVGGTSLYVQDQSGTYGTETSWSGTSGGFSQVEAEPSYQQNVQSTGVRTTPDVAYDADPNTGFAVYDSVPYQGSSGWQVVGGTSAGSPQWAALIAIANQGRVLSGQGTLDGVSQTLPALYALYAAPGSESYSAYTSDFNDVIDHTSGGRYHWRWGGYGQSNPATSGYDTATGLGTPKVGQVVSALVGSSSTGSVGGTNGTGGSNSGLNATPQQLPASQLDGIFVTDPSGAVLGGTKGVARLRITNTGSTQFTGPVSITVYASLNTSTDSASLAADTFVTTVNLAHLNLGAGKSQGAALKFTYPSGMANAAYYLIASIDETGLNTAPAVVATPTPVTISPPLVDLAATFAAGQVVKVTPGKNGFAVVTITNKGNVAATGSFDLSLYASTSQTLNTATDSVVGSVSGRPIHLAAGHSIRVAIRYEAPASLTPGTYNLIASLTSSTQPADTNAANDVAVAATRA